MDPLVDFLRYTQRSIAAGLAMPYELLCGDLSQTNFSSARVGLHSFQRRCAAIRASVLVERLLRPTWARMVTLEVLSGTINVPAFTDMTELFELTVMWPAWPIISPKEDTDADVAAIAAGIVSRQAVVEARGRDVEDVDREIAADTFTPRPAQTNGASNVAA
jgi:capsid protein